MIDLYLKKFGLEGGTISLIPSKKNSVYLIEKNRGKYILKVYKLFGKRGFYREKAILSKNHYPLVPSLYKTYKKEAILLEFIKGEKLFTLPYEAFTSDLLLRIVEWFYRFHKENPGYIRGDAIPQNFILTPEKEIIGIDFEEAKRGDIHIDIAEFAAFIIVWRKIPPQESKDITRLFIDLWIKRSGYNSYPIIKDYILKFFKKFYFFRKDKRILRFIDNIDSLIIG